jgi:hypothetical protein
MDHTENASPNSSTFACVFIASGTCLPSHYLATLWGHRDNISRLLFFQNKESRVNMDLRELLWHGKDWIHLAQDRDQWRALVNTVMNLQFPHIWE